MKVNISQILKSLKMKFQSFYMSWTIALSISYQETNMIELFSSYKKLKPS